MSLTTLGIDAATLRQLLSELGVRVVDEGDLNVVVTDHNLLPELVEINRQAISSEQPWLLIKPVGGMVWVGPLFQRGETACWACLANHIRSNFPVLGFIDNSQADGEFRIADRARNAATMSIAWGLAANSVANLIASNNSAAMFKGYIQTFNLLTWKSETPVLMK